MLRLRANLAVLASAGLSACCLTPVGPNDGKDQDGGTGGSSSGGLNLPRCSLGGSNSPGVTTLYAGGNQDSLFDEPTSLALGPDCSIFVADGQGNLVRFDAQGNGKSIDLSYPDAGQVFANGLAVDASGNLYFTDDNSHQVHRVDPSGVVTTLAGNGLQGFTDGTDGAPGKAEFSGPYGLAMGPDGNLYGADSGNHLIRKIDSAGTVTTLAVHGDAENICGLGGPDGGIDMAANPSGLDALVGVAVDGDGNVFVANYPEPRICKVDRNGNATIVVDLRGSQTYPFAEFGGPQTLTIGSDGRIYAADQIEDLILKIDEAETSPPWPAMTERLARPGVFGSAIQWEWSLMVMAPSMLLTTRTRRSTRSSPERWSLPLT
jgi:sugar lactone lactonase YvrE